MNQTRMLLIAAWLFVAAMLWMQWGKDKTTQDAPASTPAVASRVDSTVPGAPVPVAGSATPSAPSVPVPVTAATPTAQAGAAAVTVQTDVLRLRLDGGAIRSADLLAYPETTDAGSPPVRLFSDDPKTLYEAQSGWVSGTNAAPAHDAAFVPVATQRDYQLGKGATTLDVAFLWQGPDGVSIRRTYTFHRNDYAVQVRDEVVNAGAQPWQGAVYRQLLRVPPVIKTGYTHPESFSFLGSAWYSSGDKFEKRKFSDYADGGSLDKHVTGGWIAMLQHHFFSAWIPGANDASVFSLAWPQGALGQQALIREVGPSVTVAPGQRATTQARLWVGPKLVKQIAAQNVPGLDRAVDFSSYTLLAALAGVMMSVLSFLHGVLGNWGWAIVGLVLIIKLLLYPLSAAQYKSMAKMRRFQPRIEQLKERYGDDKQKLQMATMELYRKEKINPVGGCLPVLIQMPIFLTLYWTLLESVELRQAPWIGWIHNLTAPDPYFILPVLNIAIMWVTQQLSPTPGMDPTQKKIMQIMPLAFGVAMVFFPAGLVLYWVTNGALNLLQQWWNMKRYGDKPDPGKAVARK